MAHRVSDAAGDRRSLLPLGLLLASYAALLAAWVVTNPPGAAPDEANHYIRALAMGRGDPVGAPNPQLGDPPDMSSPPKSSGTDALRSSWVARGARLVRVPGGLGPTPGFGCEGFDPTKTSRCQQGFSADPEPSDQLTTMGTVEPVPYVLPGLATRLAGGPVSGLLLARAGGALLVALLLAGAAAALWSWSGVALAGFAVAVTPMVVFVGSSLSGSGMEAAAAVGFFAAVLRIGLGPEPTRAAWVTAGASGAALASSRSLGPVWVLAGMAAVAGAAGVRPVWERVRSGGRWAAGALGAIALATAATVAWELVHQPGVDFDAALFRRQLGPGVGTLRGAGKEAIGVFGNLDSHLPGVAYGVWVALLVALVAGAAAAGTRRHRVVLAALVVAVPGAAVLVSAGIMRQNGFGLQGRHVLPFATLLPLFAGSVLAVGRAALPPVWRRWAFPVFAVPAALVQGVAWYANARRYAVGSRGPVVFFEASEWSPPGGWEAWAVVVVLAVAAAVAGGLAAARSPATVSPAPIGRRPSAGYAPVAQ